eukprot:2202615-Alexandrium_andersonii.AAC.1
MAATAQGCKRRSRQAVAAMAQSCMDAWLGVASAQPCDGLQVDAQIRTLPGERRGDTHPQTQALHMQE